MNQSLLDSKASPDNFLQELADLKARVKRLENYPGPAGSATGIAISALGSPTLDDLQGWLDMSQSSGKFYGADITAHSPISGNVDVSALRGMGKTADGDLEDIYSFELAAVSDLAMVDGATNYIYVDMNGSGDGVPGWAVTQTRSDIEMYRDFPVGLVYRDGTTTHILESGMQLQNHARRAHERTRELSPFARASGGNISESGNRYIASDAGVFYRGLNRVTTDAVDTDGAPTFTRWYHDGAGDWTSDQKSQICAAAYQYDTGTGLGNVTLYGVFWVFVHYDSDLHVVMGRGNYKLADAQASEVPTLPDSVNDFGVLAARIIIKFNGVNFYAVESAYSQMFAQTGGIDHNDTGSKQGGTAGEYYHLTATEYPVVRLSTPLKSASWTASAKSAADNVQLDTSAVFGAPAGITGAFVFVQVTDTTANRRAQIETTTGVGAAVEARTQVANIPKASSGYVPCDANGDFWIDFNGAIATVTLWILAYTI